MKCIDITCPNCKKIFEVEFNLITPDGREVKCSACDNIWFYKIKQKQKNFLDILKKYPSEIPKDLEDLISESEASK
ncbi:MAG: hypothetical protein EVA55_03125 [alpha proteobacterium HIMB114]|nr:MAG: hypothetical protein EVA55_03125 [alpha proteobacterium HIMB114]